MEFRSPSAPAPALSTTVVVCTRNRPALLERCLASLARLAYPRYQVLVVDNLPSDGRAGEVAARHGARHLVDPVAGLSHARNVGARACSTEIVAYLDDDECADEQWLTQLVREFDDPQVMAVAGRIRLLPDPTAPSEVGEDLGGTERRVVDRAYPLWFELANFGGIGNGGNMAFRRSVFSQWSGFDERLGLGGAVDGCEEHHAFFSLIDQGHRVVYTPSAVVRHPHAADPAAKQRKNVAVATAYFAFLLAEVPGHRLATIKYLLEALRGVRRTWRPPTGAPPARSQLGWRGAVAALSGPLRYAARRW